MIFLFYMMMSQDKIIIGRKVYPVVGGEKSVQVDETGKVFLFREFKRDLPVLSSSVKIMNFYENIGIAFPDNDHAQTVVKKRHVTFGVNLPCERVTPVFVVY